MDEDLQHFCLTQRYFPRQITNLTTYTYRESFK